MQQDSVVGVCPICRRNVYFMESHYVDYGTDYHEPCYIKHLCVLKKKLDTKKAKGSITLDEAHELEDTEQNLIKATSPEEDKCNKYISERKYEKLICKPLLREDCMRSNINKNIKLLEESRSQRWAFEALNAMDSIFYISAPEEKKQLTEGDLNATM